MRCLIFRLAVAIFTFIIGVAAVSVWFVFRHEYTEPTRKLPTTPALIQQRTYDNRFIADGVTEEGYSMGHGSMTSSDGINFSWQRVTYKNSQRANRELQRRLEQAVEIVRREPNVDEHGRQVGEKVVATFEFAKGSPAVVAEILWTSGSDYGYVESSSLSNILEYEKDHRR